MIPHPYHPHLSCLHLVVTGPFGSAKDIYFLQHSTVNLPKTRKSSETYHQVIGGNKSQNQLLASDLRTKHSSESQSVLHRTFILPDV